MLKKQNPQIVFFIETKLCKSYMEKVRFRYGHSHGIEVDLDDTRGGLCLAWRNETSVTLQSFSKRHIDVMINDSEVRGVWRFMGFYGSPYTHDREDS